MNQRKVQIWENYSETKKERRTEVKDLRCTWEEIAKKIFEYSGNYALKSGKFLFWYFICPGLVFVKSPLIATAILMPPLLFFLDSAL